MNDEMNDQNDWEELIDRHLRGELKECEKERLAELLDTDVGARQAFVDQVQWDTEFGEALRECGHSGDADILAAQQAKRDSPLVTKPTFLRLMLAAAAVVIVALAAGLIYQLAYPKGGTPTNNIAHQRPAADVPIAKITGLSGSLIWTGDRGQIVRDVKVGTGLAGGTIEGMGPDSWFELQFNDGSTVMISGTSMLTFADLGQKELRLREGIFSANVKPQPAGKPMLIHTRSALLEVLGTQFDVKTNLTSTELNVSEGKVRVKRRSDGREVDVPAKHRVIAGDEREMTPKRVPDSIHHWKSQLDLGPTKAWGNYGKWIPAKGKRQASMKAIPFVPQENQKITLHLLGLPVVHSENSPVVIKPNSRFVVRGRLKDEARVSFGIRMAHPNGEFAGKFLTWQQVSRSDGESNFELVFPLESFALDPCVRDRKDELPNSPDDLVLTGVWAFTHTGAPSGLEVTEVELMPPDQRAPQSGAAADGNL